MAPNPCHRWPVGSRKMDWDRSLCRCQGALVSSMLVVARLPVAYCTPTAGLNFVPADLSTRSTVSACPGRRGGRQCRDGKLLQSAATQCLGPAAVGHPRTVTNRDRHLDRTHLAPPASTSPPRPVDPDRIRNHHVPSSTTSYLTTATRSCSSPGFDRARWLGVSRDTGVPAPPNGRIAQHWLDQHVDLLFRDSESGSGAIDLAISYVGATPWLHRTLRNELIDAALRGTPHAVAALLAGMLNQETGYDVDSIIAVLRKNMDVLGRVAAEAAQLVQDAPEGASVLDAAVDFWKALLDAHRRVVPTEVVPSSGTGQGRPSAREGRYSIAPTSSAFPLVVGPTSSIVRVRRDATLLSS